MLPLVRDVDLLGDTHNRKENYEVEAERALTNSSFKDTHIDLVSHLCRLASVRSLKWTR